MIKKRSLCTAEDAEYAEDVFRTVLILTCQVRSMCFLIP